MRTSTQSGLLLAATALLASPSFAGGSCGTSSHCYLPRWIPDTADSFHEIGDNVAFDGNTAAVGAPGANAIYVYERNGALWSQVAVLDDPLGSGNDFGAGLDVRGDVLVAGSPEDDTLVAGAGAIHIFERIGGSWTLTETFLDPSPTANGRFGHAVSVAGVDLEGAGEWIGVGAPGDSGTGTVHSLYRINGGWTYNGQHSYEAAGQYGWDLDIQTLGALGHSAQFFVGSWGNDIEGTNAGAVHRLQVTTGITVVYDVFTLPELEDGDYFGASISYDGEHLLVGAYGDDDVVGNAGAAYLFEVGVAASPQPSLIKKLLPCEGTTDGRFGWSVDIDGAYAAVGSPKQQTGMAPGGRVHIFWPGLFGTWDLAETIAPLDSASGDRFGHDVEVAGSTFFVGANGVDAPGGDHGGAAYMISKEANLPGGECPCEALAMAESYGAGKPGSLGLPALSASAPVPGTTGTIALKNALPGVAPILLYGLTPAQLPLDGGTLLIADPSFTLMPVVGGLQQTGIGWSVPAGPALCGQDVYVQALFLDPGATGTYGTAQSNGLRLSVGY